MNVTVWSVCIYIIKLSTYSSLSSYNLHSYAKVVTCNIFSIHWLELVFTCHVSCGEILNSGEFDIPQCTTVPIYFDMLCEK